MERLLVGCLSGLTCCLAACQQEDSAVVQVYHRSQETRTVTSYPGYEGWCQQIADETDEFDDESSLPPPKYGDEQDPDRDLEDASDASAAE
jgi:hypothetical protein